MILRLNWNFTEEIMSLWDEWRNLKNSDEIILFADKNHDIITFNNKEGYPVIFRKNKGAEFEVHSGQNMIFISSKNISNNNYFGLEYVFEPGLSDDLKIIDKKFKEKPKLNSLFWD